MKSTLRQQLQSVPWVTILLGYGILNIVTGFALLLLNQWISKFVYEQIRNLSFEEVSIFIRVGFQLILVSGLLLLTVALFFSSIPKLLAQKKSTTTEQKRS